MPMNLFAIIKENPDGSREWYRGNSFNNYQIRVWEDITDAKRYIKRHAKPEENASLEIVRLTYDTTKRR